MDRYVTVEQFVALVKKIVYGSQGEMERIDYDTLHGVYQPPDCGGNHT